MSRLRICMYRTTRHPNTSTNWQTLILLLRTWPYVLHQHQQSSSGLISRRRALFACLFVTVALRAIENCRLEDAAAAHRLLNTLIRTLQKTRVHKTNLQRIVLVSSRPSRYYERCAWHGLLQLVRDCRRKHVAFIFDIYAFSHTDGRTDIA